MELVLQKRTEFLKTAVNMEEVLSLQSKLKMDTDIQMSGSVCR